MIICSTRVNQFGVKGYWAAAKSSYLIKLRNIKYFKPASISIQTLDHLAKPHHILKFYWKLVIGWRPQDKS